MDSLISVIIPTYNAGRFIRDTLESVFCQELLPAEIIVVDDQSQDQTCEVVAGLVGSSPVPLRLIRLERNSGGPATPLNIGMEMAAHPLIALLDHDDLMVPSKLRKQARCFAEVSDLVLVFSNYLYFDEQTECSSFHGLTPQLTALAEHKGDFVVVPGDAMARQQLLYSGTIQSCSNLLFPKKLLGKNPFDPSRSVIADYIVKLELSLRGPVAFIPEPLFKKRIHEANLFQQVEEKQTTRQVYQVIQETLERHPNLLDDNVFRTKVRKIFLARAWAQRQHGHFREALALYQSCLWQFGLSWDLCRQCLLFPLSMFLRTAQSMGDKRP